MGDTEDFGVNAVAMFIFIGLAAANDNKLCYNFEIDTSKLLRAQIALKDWMVWSDESIHKLVGQ